MGANPRPRTWTPAQWRNIAPSVSDLMRHGWPVSAHCLHCHLVMAVDLSGVAQARGADFVLWGQTAKCRRRYCTGRMAFYCQPLRAGQDIPMF
jgi:hypothetical protein